MLGLRHPRLVIARHSTHLFSQLKAFELLPSARYVNDQGLKRASISARLLRCLVPGAWDVGKRFESYKDREQSTLRVCHETWRSPILTSANRHRMLSRSHLNRSLQSSPVAHILSKQWKTNTRAPPTVEEANVVFGINTNGSQADRISTSTGFSASKHTRRIQSSPVVACINSLGECCRDAADPQSSPEER